MDQHSDQMPDAIRRYPRLTPYQALQALVLGGMGALVLDENGEYQNSFNPERSDTAYTRIAAVNESYHFSNLSDN